MPALLVDDVLGEIEHVLGDFDVLDLVEILRLAAHLVGIAQQRADQPLLHRLERDDVLAVGQHHPADRDLVHLADGLADHREGVVADLAVRTQIVGTDQVARIDLALSTNSSMSIVRVDSRATFSSSSLLTSMKVSLSSA